MPFPVGGQPSIHRIPFYCQLTSPLDFLVNGPSSHWTGPLLTGPKSGLEHLLDPSYKYGDMLAYGQKRVGVFWDMLECRILFVLQNEILETHVSEGSIATIHHHHHTDTRKHFKSRLLHHPASCLTPKIRNTKGDLRLCSLSVSQHCHPAT